MFIIFLDILLLFVSFTFVMGYIVPKHLNYIDFPLRIYISMILQKKLQNNTLKITFVTIPTKPKLIQQE